MQLQNRHRTVFTLLTLLIAAIAVACSSGSDGPADGSSSFESSSETRITAASGGELRSSDDTFILTVPPGAVSEDVTISFEIKSADDAPNDLPGATGIGFELKPDGLQFNQPARVTLTLPIESTGTGEVPGLSVFDLFSVSGSGEVTGLENVSNDFDTVGGKLKLTGDLGHFSALYRTKSLLTVFLEQVTPAERAVGSKWSVVGSVSNENANDRLGVSWVMEAQRAISMTRVDSTWHPSSEEEDVRVLPINFTSSKASSQSATDISDAYIRVIADMRCDTAGSGTYTFTGSSRTNSTSVAANHGRIDRISLSGRVSCVTDAEATAAAGDSAAATAIARILDATPAPTRPAPTATTAPNINRGEEKLRLVFVAMTGEDAPGTEDRFTQFDAPTTGGGKLIFHGFTDGETTGIWQYEEDELIGGELKSYITTVSPSQVGRFAFIESSSMPVTESGSSAGIARLKTDTGFTDSAYLFSPVGFPVTIVNEEDPAPGLGEGAKFRQFRGVQLRAAGIAVIAANAGSEGLWSWNNGSLALVAFEGQALPGLAPDWRAGKAVRSTGFTDDGTVILFLDDYRFNAANGQEQKGDGLWRVGGGSPLKVVQTGDTGPDGQIFTKISDPSTNSIAQVAFLAQVQDTEQRFDTAVWRTTPQGRLARVAGPGDVIAALGIELAEVSSPLMLDDGRVMFVAAAFDDSRTLVEYILIESSNGFEVVAFSETLPDPDGNPIDTTNYRPQLAKLSVNASNHVAFELGLAFGIWMQSPGGFLYRVIGIGDKLEVPGASGTKTEKSVAFAEFVGGVATRTGLPTAYSDDHHLALRVQFTDGTQAIVLATFDDAPVVP